MNTSMQNNVCNLNTLNTDELTMIHSSLSHQVIDICRNMRHDNLTLHSYSGMVADMTALQKVIHKVGVCIENHKKASMVPISNEEVLDYNWLSVCGGN